MPNKKLVRFLIIIFMGIVFLYMGCFFRFDRFGLSQISWVDCVQINGKKYYSDFDRISIDASVIDKKIGEVKFNVSEKVHNPSYRFRNSDATFLDVGTEIYSISSVSNAIAIKIADQYYIYKSDLLK